MKTAFHYVVKAKLVRFKKGNDIDFLEFEEKFEDESPIIARNKAFNHYQNYIDVLLEGKNKKYISDRQARKELTSFIDLGTKTKIKIQEKEIEISDSLGNGIGIFMVIDKLKPNTDDKIGDEFFIHGIGSIGLSYDPDYVIFHLNFEFNGDFETLETELINKHRPLVNLAKNPLALSELSDLRKICVQIANEL